MHTYRQLRQLLPVAAADRRYLESLAGKIQLVHTLCKTIAQEGFQRNRQARSDMGLFCLQNHSTFHFFCRTK